MILTKKNLFSLAVVTDRGVRVGRVADIELDSKAHSVVTYVVRPYWRLRIQNPLLVKRSQVVALTDKELIIEDTAIPIPTRAKASKETLARAPVV